MINPLIVINPNIVRVNLFEFKCVHCGNIGKYSEIRKTCPKCSAELFETMQRTPFTNLFVEALTAIGVDQKKATDFTNKKSIRVSDLGICTEMSVAIDLPFETKFGGQYKSFFIKDSFGIIRANNFKARQ